MNFSDALRHWYSIHKRALPWREEQNPYQIWLSEIILQQTQVSQGLPYYERFIEQFPNLEDLANASEEEVLKLWQGLGYYSRARNLHATARYVIEHLNGKFPTSYDQLIKLKGIGDYTASAIASICSDEACAVVDGNVYRVLSRYFGESVPINSNQGIKIFKDLAQRLLPQSNIGEHNQAIMEFGARQCRPKNPNCASCPVSQSCVACNKDMIAELPVKLKKSKVRHRYFNYLVYQSNGKTKLEKRNNTKDIWQSLYQFPLVETTKELTPRTFSKNEQIKEHLNGLSTQAKLFNTASIIHKLSHQHLYTKFWIVETNENLEYGIPISELEKYPVPTLIKNFIDAFYLG